MKLLGVILLLVMSLDAHAQYDLQAKEMFDKLDHKVVYYGTYDGIVNYMLHTNPWSNYQYGEQIGPTLEGYIRLYETTKDKGYLIKFVNLALKAVAWRQTNYRFNDLLYMDGHLLWPLAHFIHLILIEDPDLASFGVMNNMGLIEVPTSTISANELPYQTIYTFHELASWLLVRCVESLDAIIADEWDYNVGFGGAVNLQAAFAGALLHLGHMGFVNSDYSGLQSYFDRGARLASLFRSHVNIDDDCSCSNYALPVLRTGSHNSYWWYHSGWHVETVGSCINQCPPFFHFDQPDLDTFQEYIEDISHAIPTLIIPFMSHRYSVYTNGFYPFTDTEMVRFRNTFTKLVWDANAGGFHNAVNGQDGPVYPPEYNGQFNLLRVNALAWMPLQRFDQTPGAAAGDQVYDVIMNLYSNEIHGQPTSLTGGFHYLGLAEVVAAQWEHECFDLTLFNRELPYNQDFAARHVLTIHPAGEAGMSFADPRISDARFTILPGVHSTHRAGGAVIWEPGFEAQHGSVVEAVIDPLGCDMIYKSQQTGANGPATSALLAADTAAYVRLNAMGSNGTALDLEDKILIVPNPNDGRASVHITLRETSTGTLHLIDATGRGIWQRGLGMLTAGEHRIELPPLSSGIYHCRIDLPNSSMAERVVVQ